jgi:SAM-dependent methyltransferase
MSIPLCIACHTPLKNHIKNFGNTCHDLWFCPNCKTNQTLPLPSDQELEKFYQGFMFNVPTGKHADLRETVIRRNTMTMINLLRKKYHLDQHNARILDYGGGVGIVASELGRAGYHVDLFDLDSKACRYARERFQEDLEQITSNSLDIPVGTYDLVYSSQVIEHLPNPIDHLKDMYAKLRDGGIIVLTTPNQSSSEYWFRLKWLKYYLSKAGNMGIATKTRAFLTQKWLNFDPPRHLYGFNQKGISLIGKIAGFQKLDCFAELGHQSIFNSPRPLPRWHAGLIPMPLHMLESLGLRMAARLFPFFISGNNLVYIGKKPTMPSSTIS